MGRRRSVESLPLDARDEPFPLTRGEGGDGGIGGWPDEMALMQTSLTKPDARAVPNEELDSVAPTIPKGVGGTIARRTVQGLLNY